MDQVENGYHLFIEVEGLKRISMVSKSTLERIQEPETETNLAVSVAAGIGSGLIKIPLGLASVAAEVYDAVQGEGVKY